MDKEFPKFLRVVAIAIYVMLTVAECSVIWNKCSVASAKALAGALFCANGFVVFLAIRKIKKERDAGENKDKKQ